MVQVLEAEVEHRQRHRRNKEQDQLRCEIRRQRSSNRCRVAPIRRDVLRIHGTQQVSIRQPGRHQASIYKIYSSIDQVARTHSGLNLLYG